MPVAADLPSIFIIQQNLSECLCSISQMEVIMWPQDVLTAVKLQQGCSFTATLRMSCAFVPLRTLTHTRGGGLFPLEYLFASNCSSTQTFIICGITESHWSKFCYQLLHTSSLLATRGEQIKQHLEDLETSENKMYFFWLLVTLFSSVPIEIIRPFISPSL